ncbi:CBL-interacting serine/threonine-protein kinase 23 [Abrus precatorius]|uniref:non-specific serine/threonine protein kinase n=1 Tax=Abrus precatorius TaxID=3816 RepID=A0A8B8KJ38_ABRPR|nr:CBL-interacting serine/threonine-protein kinase 23 [Abrus precatorius]
MDLIVREISIMRMIRHPNVVRLYEVMASRKYIYMVMERVDGGELYDKFEVNGHGLREDEARKFFHQLICAVDFCHSRGVFHRDLKPENLLIAADGSLKVSDFGLSALPQQLREDGRLHTMCGSTRFMAPEVMKKEGYEGAKADIWSCGIVLFTLLAGQVPFEDNNSFLLCQKIFQAKLTFPSYISSSVKRLLKRIIDPNPDTRITIQEIYDHEWFKKDYQPPRFSLENIALDEPSTSLGTSINPQNLVERRQERPTAAVPMNAFEILSTPLGFNLFGNFFSRVLVKRETKSIYRCSTNQIVPRIEQAAASMGFHVRMSNNKLRIRGERAGRKGHLTIASEIFEVASPFHMVEFRKAGGDTPEFHTFYKDLSTGLSDILWKAEPVDVERDGASTSNAGAGTSTAT